MNIADKGGSNDCVDSFALLHEAMEQVRQARDVGFVQLPSRAPCSVDERMIRTPSGCACLQDFLRCFNPSAASENLDSEFTFGFSKIPLVDDSYGAWPPRAWIHLADVEPVAGKPVF